MGSERLVCGRVWGTRTNMEIWLDCLNEDLIERGCSQGWLYGVTTNPSIVSASGRSLEDVLKYLLAAQQGPVAAQVMASDAETMVEQGLRLHEMDARIICKIPVTNEGYIALRELSDRGVPTMATATFEARQALLAAQAGALYVAPYVGAIAKEAQQDPFPILAAIQQIYSNYKYGTKVLAASCQNVAEMMRCAELGLAAVTLKEAVARELLNDALTTLSRVERFAIDWKKAASSSLF